MKTKKSPSLETFRDIEVETAITQFLQYGEQQFGKSQGGYFSGSGWAARCLRYHLKQIQAQRRANTEAA